jgi:hypothetical protein
LLTWRASSASLSFVSSSAFFWPFGRAAQIERIKDSASVLAFNHAAIKSGVMSDFSNNNDPPEICFQATNFAEMLAQRFIEQGGNPKDLFVAFVGIVAGLSSVLAEQCLIAMDDEIGKRAMLKNKPRAP